MAEYIEREKAYEAVLFATCGSGYQYEATYAIDRIPEADVAPVVHGRWVYGEFDIPHCSECGNDVMPNMISPYCPNCGAKMDEEEHNNV